MRLIIRSPNAPMTSSASIKVGVVIINYNSAQYLMKALSALEMQNHPPDEVIVFDNASSERLSGKPDSFGLNLKFIQSKKNLGFAGGNNRAIECLDASINWIALLNPDAYPNQDWLANLVAAITNHPEYAFFGCKLICDHEPHLLDGTGDAYHISGRAWRMHHRKPIAHAPNYMVDIFSPCAAAAIYQRDAFQAAGGFDERFFCYYEDIDLSFRLRLLGYKSAYVPDAIVAHAGSATTIRHSDFYTYHGHRNLVWTYFKNMPFWLLIFSLPGHVLLNMVSIFILIKRGQTKTIFKAKMDAIKGIKIVYQQRKTIQKRRMISTKTLLKSLRKGWPW